MSYIVTSIRTGFIKLITAVATTVTSNWILATYFWNDNGIWDDTQTWND